MNTPRARTRRRDRRAFTLLEVIVVVTIIALLSTMVAPRIWTWITKAKGDVARAEVSAIAQQVQLWMVDHGRASLPSDFELEMLVSGSNPQLEPDDLLDPWERAYVLVNPGQANHDFDIVCFAEDGEPGGVGAAADIIN